MTDSERILELLKAGGQFGTLRTDRFGEKYFSPCLYLVHDPYRGITSVGYSCYGSSAIDATPEAIEKAIYQHYQQDPEQFVRTHEMMKGKLY